MGNVLCILFLPEKFGSGRIGRLQKPTDIPEREIDLAKRVAVYEQARKKHPVRWRTLRWKQSTTPPPTGQYLRSGRVDRLWALTQY
jgi:hypothetical protein